jgi:hypothetical protein
VRLSVGRLIKTDQRASYEDVGDFGGTKESWRIVGIEGFQHTLRGAASAWRVSPNDDGTVDLAEAKAAASKLFDRLDRDHNGTLDRRELRSHTVSKEFGAADGDHDGTLDKNEYLAFVEKNFKAADRDNDGTLDAKELSAAGGRALLRLLQ